MSSTLKHRADPEHDEESEAQAGTRNDNPAKARVSDISLTSLRPPEMRGLASTRSRVKPGNAGAHEFSQQVKMDKNHVTRRMLVLGSLACWPADAVRPGDQREAP